MDHPNAFNRVEEAMETSSTPMLFNDVYFSRREATSPVFCDNVTSTTTWAPFSRLPVELRQHIWRLHLRRHRMLEIDLCKVVDDGDSCHYTERNHLGRIVSGGRYTLRVRGRGSYAASLSSLLRVNREARGAARSFYHIHIPFHGWQHTGRERVLYLSSEYDVVYVRPRQPKTTWPPEPNPPPLPRFEAILVDFLHDARAYDYKDKGVAHLALDRELGQYLFDEFTGQPAYLTPEILHPAAVASFTDILRHKLRSIFCIIGFRCPTRGMGVFPMARWRFHFAQTFPLCRRGYPIGAFDWLKADPRPGVELDLRQLSLNDDPHRISRGWRQIQQAFGITTEQQATRGNDARGFRLYICPSQRWPTRTMQYSNGTITFNASHEEETEEVWSREELAQHLQYEAEHWLEERKWLGSIGTEPGSYICPMYSSRTQEEAEMFETMEKLPCTAIGMWLFPAESFPPAVNPQTFQFDLETVRPRPGLFLFQV